MGDTMTFPKTVEEFMEEYKIVDSDQVYTNGAELVPIFRMKQWFEHTNATSDAVPVVRCLECKWWKTNYLWNGTERKVCVIEPYEPCRKPDDYCSRGECKGGDE